MRKKKTLVTYLLIIACTLVYIAECLSCHNMTIDSHTLLKFGAVFTLGIHNMSATCLLMNLPRLFTAMFVHLTPDHLVSNMLFLVIMGRYLETLYGHFKFLLLYLLSGIFGNLAVVLLSYKATITAGASTALFGLIATGIILPKVYDNPQFYEFSQMSLGILLSNLLIDIFTPEISLIGHLGGLIGGFIFGYLLSPKTIKLNKFNNNSTFNFSKINNNNEHHNKINIKNAIYLLVLIVLLFIGGKYLLNNNSVPIFNHSNVKNVYIDKNNADNYYSFDDNSTYNGKPYWSFISKKLILPKQVSFISHSRWNKDCLENHACKYNHAYLISANYTNYDNPNIKFSYDTVFNKVAQMANEKIRNMQHGKSRWFPVRYVSINDLCVLTNKSNKITYINFDILVGPVNKLPTNSTALASCNKKILDDANEFLECKNVLPHLSNYDGNKEKASQQVKTTITVDSNQTKKLISKDSDDNYIFSNDTISFTHNVSDYADQTLGDSQNDLHVVNEKQITQQLNQVNQSLPVNQRVNNPKPSFVHIDQVIPTFDNHGNVTDCKVVVTFYSKK